MNTELPSAANEGKLTEAETLAMSQLRRSLEDVISEHAGHGFVGHMRPAGVGCETYVVAWAMLALLPEGTPIGARLSAREPDNEACADCGHLSRHDERWGCMAEVGDNGSGSVADAVFCRCRATAVPVSGVPTEAVRELLGELDGLTIYHSRDAGDVYNADAVDELRLGLRALVQRAAETNEGSER